jgi:hypothetical protein
MQALTIGSLARQQVQRAQIATLIGQSSHGLYLRLETAWVIFLSWDNSPGPLTIQLACALPEKLASGTRLKIAPDSLVFPPPVGRLNLRIAEVWQAPPARLGPAGLLPPLERPAAGCRCTGARTHWLTAGITTCLIRSGDRSSAREWTRGCGCNGTAARFGGWADALW